MLPDGRTVLFTLATGAVRWDQAQIVVQSLDTGERTTLINGGTDVRYLPTGHIVYALQGMLLAVPFDSESHQVTGGPGPWLKTYGQPPPLASLSSVFPPTARSRMYQASRRRRFGAPWRGSTIRVAKRQSRLLRAPTIYPRLSPDGTHIALDIVEENRDIWVWDVARGTLTRLTSESHAGPSSCMDSRRPPHHFQFGQGWYIKSLLAARQRNSRRRAVDRKSECA